MGPTPTPFLFKPPSREDLYGALLEPSSENPSPVKKSPPMGRKFKFSSMMPNAWFYKLRDMAVVNSDQKKHHVSRSSSSTASSSSSSSVINHHSGSRPSQIIPRKSYHFARQVAERNVYYDFPLNSEFSGSRLPEPARKSANQRRRRRTVARSPPKLVGAGCRCEPTRESVWSKSESPPEFSSSPFDSSPDGDFRTDAVLATESFHGVVSWTASRPNSSACKITKTNLNDHDIIIDIDTDSMMIKAHERKDFNSLPELELAPIITKPATFTDMVKHIKKESRNPRSRKSSAKTEEPNPRQSPSVKITKEEKIVVKEQRSTPSRKNSVNSGGVKLRVNSPRIGSRRINAGTGRKCISSSSSTTASSGSNKSLSDSLAIVKSSFDPQRDFRESMVEMIVENNIRASKDLEDLLACYLTLNSDEYHDLIIKIFKQIWFDLPNSQIKK